MRWLRRSWWIDPPDRAEREPPALETKRRMVGPVADEPALDGLGNRPTLALLSSGRLRHRSAGVGPATGKTLEPPTRSVMESSFGEDFADVRIHADARAAAMADSLDARAFAVGGDIVFGSGEYAPETAEGQSLIAHELAHVVQQRRGDTASPASGASERDADHASLAAVSGGRAQVRERAAPGALQRQPKGASAPIDLPPELLEQLEKQGVVKHEQTGPVIVGDLDPELAAQAWKLLNPQQRQNAPAIDALRLPFLPSPAGPPVDFGLPQSQPLSLFAPPPTPPHNAMAPPPAAAPPPRRARPTQPSQADITHWAREFGAIDLDRPDDLDWPPFGAVRPRDPFAAGVEAGLIRELLRKEIEAGLTLTASVSRTHFNSRAEFDKFAAEFVAAAHEISPEKGHAAEAELAKLEATLFSTEADILGERAHEQMVHRRVADQVALMKVHTPEVMKPVAAAGEVLIGEVKAVDVIADFIPYVGQVKALAEAVTGRTISGQIDQYIQTGVPLYEAPADLDISDRLLRAIPLAIEGAAKIVARAPGWAAGLARLRAITKVGDAELNVLLKDMAALQGKERQLVEALLRARRARRAFAYGAKQAFTAPAYMFMSAGGIGAVPMRVAQPLAKAAREVELVLEVEPGLNPNDVRRKAEALNDICQRKEVTKVKSPPRQLVSGGTGEAYRGVPVSVPTEYKHRLLEIAHKRFGPTSPNYDEARWRKFFDLWKSQSGDHVVDLQLSGADDIGNIWLFDAETNAALGRQIQQQLRNLPDGTRIGRVRWRIPGK